MNYPLRYFIVPYHCYGLVYLIRATYKSGATKDLEKGLTYAQARRRLKQYDTTPVRAKHAAHG